MAVNLGATYLGNGKAQFLVWAPHARKVELHLAPPDDRSVQMEKLDRGYYQALIEGVEPGTLYGYRLDGKKERPDPASRFQPLGVHECSELTPAAPFEWTQEAWPGIPLENFIVYELHVGTYTREGTFAAVIPHLDELLELGVTAIELMPVAQFPGNRNWGYDGVHPFAPQNTYGRPEDLKTLVDACHRRGLALILDVVYNHLGPEGNYFGEFGPYFTDRYRTPWGKAINFDGPGSDEVVRFCVENALYWVNEFQIDALRLDAIHGIIDHNAQPFLRTLSERIDAFAQETNRKIYLIAESDLNDVRFLLGREMWGYGMHAQWNDDFHHALHALLTHDRNGYYQDFGKVEHLAKAFSDGYVYSGEYSKYRGRRHGNSSKTISSSRLLVFAQNHDQVGNRLFGDRLTRQVSFESLKLAAGVVLLSPFVPLLFMGEEYGETAPFPYFISHGDPDLVEAVRGGRKEEFAQFEWQGEIPDPQDEATFHGAKLNHALRHSQQRRVLRDFYQSLLQRRKDTPALAKLSKETMEVKAYEAEGVLVVRRWDGPSECLMAANFSDRSERMAIPWPEGRWIKDLDSADRRWGAEGSALPERVESDGRALLQFSPRSFCLYRRG